MIDYEKVLLEFKKYLNTFDLKNKDINTKVIHSYNVANLSVKLANYLDLNEEDTLILKTIGLIHDIGRFKQFKEASDYNDFRTNIDHAKLGIKYLFEEKHIKDFAIPEKYHELIKIAIENHNKLEIDSNLDEKASFFAKFIRDVDKIDIFRQNISLELTCFDSPISKEVNADFEKKKLVDIKNCKTSSDVVVSQLAYVFDINFKESYELLIETDNMELYLSMIEVPKDYEEEFEKIKKVIRDYIEERIND